MKKLLTAALFGLMALTFVAGPAMFGSSAAYARGGHDDGAGHDFGDDHGGR